MNQIEIIPQSNQTNFQITPGNTIIIPQSQNASTVSTLNVVASTANIVQRNEPTTNPASCPNNVVIVAGASDTLSSSGPSTFIYTQAIAATVWNIAHNLRRFPSVTVVDSAGTEVIGSVQYIDQNNITLRFSVAFGGTAYLN